VNVDVGAVAVTLIPVAFVFPVGFIVVNVIVPFPLLVGAAVVLAVIVPLLAAPSRHSIDPSSTGFVEMRAGLSNVNSALPGTVPAVSRKARQVMPLRGEVEVVERILRPQVEFTPRLSSPRVTSKVWSSTGWIHCVVWRVTVAAFVVERRDRATVRRVVVVKVFILYAKSWCQNY